MNAGRHSQAKAKLIDSTQHGAGCELFLVEGDSAARSVANVRDECTQAVLPLQGKPLNAWRADADKVRSNILYRQLADALGVGDPTLASAPRPPRPLRFERVVLLFDPDADGVHIEALMLLYFARWMPTFIECGQLWRVRAPMFTLTHPATGEVAQAYSPPHRDALLVQMRSSASGDVQQHRHVGLGSLPPAVLRRYCIDPATRVARQVGQEDVDAVLAAFGLEETL
ncbi:toprim domain-containing protein [Solilutibacter tolerans]|uniref:DNA topoisomerase (ATP-hydrolyzing) n=1 Tax=Solilutibacter tolerans TaxID=1604334 RepID=A0A1N6QWG5_9GAMM|nr:toprim domain-containing protein [Lysobacter tolerans]SIQ20917.1 DNA gyrase subunit B/topoisomerase-4 subunit B [Lysobacter tolerans]